MRSISYQQKINGCGIDIPYSCMPVESSVPSLIEFIKKSFEEQNFDEFNRSLVSYGQTCHNLSNNDTSDATILGICINIIDSDASVKIKINSIWTLTQMLIYRKNVFINNADTINLLRKLIVHEANDSGLKQSILILISTAISEKEILYSLLESITTIEILDFIMKNRCFPKLKQFFYNLLRHPISDEFFDHVITFIHQNFSPEVLYDCLSVYSRNVENFDTYLREKGLIAYAKNTIGQINPESVGAFFRIIGLARSLTIQDFNTGISKNSSDHVVATGIWALSNSENIGGEEIIPEFISSVFTNILMNPDRSYKCKTLTAYFICKYIEYCGESIPLVLLQVAQYVTGDDCDGQVTAMILNTIVKFGLCEECYDILGEAIEELCNSLRSDVSESATHYMKVLEESE